MTGAARLATPWGAAAAIWLAACGRQPVLDVPVTVRNHHDVAIRSDGGLTPLYLQPASRPGICLRVAATTDTSRWQARLTLGTVPLDTGYSPPSARMGQILCFEAEIPSDLPAVGETELCGRLVDRFDQTVYRLPCRRVGYAPDMPYGDFKDSRSRILQTAPERELDDLLNELDALAARARPDFPLSAARLELIAVHFLREDGAPAARAAASRRLASLPAWLDRPSTLR